MWETVLFYLSSIAVVLTVLVHSLLLIGRATNNHVFEFYGRIIAFFLALLVCASYGTIASAILTAVGYGGLGQWTTAKAFKWTMLLFSGVWFDVRDENNYLNTTRPAVFLGNHQTELDILLLGHIWPKYCSVTAKKSLKYMPVLGWFSKSIQSTSYSRGSRD